MKVPWTIMKFEILFLLLIIDSQYVLSQSSGILGDDTLVCKNHSLDLESKINGSQYRWSTDDTTKIIKVYQNGTFWVEVNKGGNIQRDTIEVSFKDETFHQSNHWVLGNNVIIEFDSANPKTQTPITPTNNFNFPAGSASISGPDGKILFYTNGQVLYNKLDNEITNDLAGDPSASQNSLFVPKPGSNRYIYLFTIGNKELRYSIIDKFSINGTGGITQKNILLHSNVDEKLTGIETQDKKGIWIITHLSNSNTFASFRITSNQLSSAVYSSVGKITNNSAGYMKVSTNKRYLATAGEFTEVFEFNESNGKVSNPVDLNVEGTYGLEFSQNGSKLFVSTLDKTKSTSGNILNGGSIISVDLEKRDLSNGNKIYPKDTIYRTDINNPTTIGALQIGRDGNIYFVKDGADENCLGKIVNPGGNMVVEYNSSLCLPSGNTNRGLPNFIQHYFGNRSIISYSVRNKCFGDSTIFSASTIFDDKPYAKVRYQWNLGEPANVNNNFNIPLAQIIYSDTGKYKVILKIDFSCGSETKNQNIKILPYPELKIKDTVLCNSKVIPLFSGGNAQYPRNDLKFSWKKDETIIDTNQTYLPKDTGTYSISVTLFRTCTSTDTFGVSYASYPEVNLGTDTNLCMGKQHVLKAPLFTNAIYEWSTGETIPEISINSSGTYAVAATYGKCISRDTIVAVFYSPPLSVNFPDQSFCPGDIVKLEAGNLGFKYQWISGETSESIKIKSPGDYWVDVYNDGCLERFKGKIKFFPKVKFNFTEDTIICEKDYEVITLDAGAGSDFLWEESNINSQFLQINKGGKYVASKVDTSTNCKGKDSIFIYTACLPRLFIPDIFTPNGDGINEIFIPVGAHISNYEMEIYNRWGELIFISKNIEDGWDGKYLGENVNEDGFVYIISYEGSDILFKQKSLKKGIVTLLK